AARDDYTTLRAFLYRMPKGGDLHTHLAGAVYAERFIAWAAQEDLCVDLENRALAKVQCSRTGARPVSDAMSDQMLYDRLVDAFSMRDFLPSSAMPAGRDEFFAAFDRFGAVSGSHFVDMTVDQLKRYEAQNRSVRRVHGLGVVPERSGEARQGGRRGGRRCGQARGARSGRACPLRRGPNQPTRGRGPQDKKLARKTQHRG